MMIKVAGTPELVHSNGLGGKIYMVSVDGSDYLVKCELYEQSVNEFVSHFLIASIGLPAPAVELVEIDRDVLNNINLGEVPIDIFGAVKFIPNLARVVDREVFSSENRNRKIAYLELLVLDRLLGDDDGTIEIFEDLNGRMYLLDLGEALISAPLILSILEEGSVPDWLINHVKGMDLEHFIYNFECALKECRYRMQKYNYVDEDILQEAASLIIVRISELDMRKMRGCLIKLRNSFGDELCEAYRQYLKQLKKMCCFVVKYQL